MQAVTRLPAALKMAVLVGAALALVVVGRSSSPGMPPIKHAAITGVGGGYFPITPTRLVDTRASSNYLGAGQRLTTGNAATFTITGASVPTGAGAVVLNVTAYKPDGDGFLSVYPGTQTTAPTTSNLNFQAGGVIPNLVVVQLPTTGTLKVYSNTGVDVIIDVAGYFSPASGTTSGPSGP